MARQYVIIGGGIAGASVAYHLSKRTDDPIILFERGSPASETTFKSVGQYGYYGDETQYQMKRYGMQIYNQFFNNPRANIRYHFMGILIAATEHENARRLKRTVKSDRDEHLGNIGKGFNRDMLEYISGEDLNELLVLPPVNTSAIAGALFRPRVGYMSRPQELAYEFLERAKDNGLVIKSGTEVTEIAIKDERVTGITTDDGQTIDADEVICTAGPWNIELAESVGVNLPVKHTLAPVLQLRPETPIKYDIPAINHYESPFAFHRRTAEELLIGYNPGYENATRYNPSMISEQVPTDVRDEGIELLSEIVPGWLDAEVVDEWVGIRSVTPDGNPVVGWTALEGFNIVAFHTSGIQLSPAVGQMIARQLVEDTPTRYYDSLSVTRFDGYSDWRF